MLLVTPPLLHPNTPYPATPVLTRALKAYGVNVTQADLSLETLLNVFTPETVRLAEEAARKLQHGDDALDYFLDAADDYFHTVAPVLHFLQGRRPELAPRIAARTYLPEGPYFQAIYEGCDADSGETLLPDMFGTSGTTEQAKFLASLYLDDLASFIAKTLDPDFAFGKYAESLCVSLPTMEPLIQRLHAPSRHFVEDILERLVINLLERQHPTHVGIAVPFPGTLLGAFRIAQTIREHAPDTVIAMGGGFVNSELRDIQDKRIFDFVDALCFDDGTPAILALLEGNTSHPYLKTARNIAPVTIPKKSQATSSPLLVPDYSGLDLNDYFDVAESTNPMAKLWADGKWLKMQLAKGCYWHKCAFCDLALDYICNYQPSEPTQIADAMEKLMDETGHACFHFVDEALSPALVRGLSEELLRRRLPVVWWGNIRFDNAFTPELAQLMADSGCIAVTGGLECAHDRLLKLMNKGITLASATKAFKAFKSANIMVHAYLMAGFPTETEKEAFEALDFVRRCFKDGLIQSAYWHRFALTAHSAVAQRPADFHVKLLQQPLDAPRFAHNEIPYAESNAPDWKRICAALDKALYNYQLGLGLDLPPRKWLDFL